MKWIGQHIWDLAARFRDDVYLENLSTTTNTDSLVVDSDGKISKNTSIGGDITSVGTLTSLAVTSASDLGSAAMTLTNYDIDQIALDINAYNTTAGILDINATYLTTGSAIKVTTNAQLAAKSTIKVLASYSSSLTGSGSYPGLFEAYFNKTGSLGGSEVAIGTGFYSNMRDTATNNSNSATTLVAFKGLVDSASAVGYGYNTGLDLTVIDAQFNTGIKLTVEDSGNDIIMHSSASASDYCAIATGANGATTITTYESGVGSTAHFEIAADGNITLDATGDIALEAGGNDVTIDTDFLILTSATSGYPVTTILATHTDKDKSGELRFRKDAADTEDGENLGRITWYGEDAGNNNTQFAGILAEISESAEGDEAGKLTFSVAESDGSGATGTSAVTAGLVLEGEHATDGQIDVTIAAGTASTTTIAGDLVVNGDSVQIGTNAGSGEGGDLLLTGNARNQKISIERTDSANDYNWEIVGGASGDVTNLKFVNDKGGANSTVLRLHESGLTEVTGDLTVTSKATIPSRVYAYPGTNAGDHLAGDVVYIDTATATTVVGKIYYLDGNGSWTIANADAEVDATGMLAVALGTDPDVDGMLLRGMVTLVDIHGTEDYGTKLHLHTTDGTVTTTVHTTGGHFVRIIGYNLHDSNDSVYFNPDNTWVEVA